MGPSGVAVFECGKCTGMWMGQESFHRLAQHARRTAAEQTIPAARPGRKTLRDDAGPEATKTERRWKYRPCAECRSLMVRHNYAKSGVVVDVCRDHGVWFDASELPRILRWLRAGGARPSRSILRRGRAGTSVRPTSSTTNQAVASPDDPWSAMARSAWQAVRELLSGSYR